MSLPQPMPLRSGNAQSQESAVSLPAGTPMDNDPGGGRLVPFGRKRKTAEGVPYVQVGPQRERPALLNGSQSQLIQTPRTGALNFPIDLQNNDLRMSEKEEIVALIARLAADQQSLNNEVWDRMQAISQNQDDMQVDTEISQSQFRNDSHRLWTQVAKLNEQHSQSANILEHASTQFNLFATQSQAECLRIRSDTQQVLREVEREIYNSSEGLRVAFQRELEAVTKRFYITHRTFSADHAQVQQLLTVAQTAIQTHERQLGLLVDELRGAVQRIQNLQAQ